MKTNPLLQIDHLSCVRQANPLFLDLSFHLGAGDVLLVEGANGSGKSSLLRLLAGLASPDAGEIRWQGKCIHAHRADFLEHLHFIGHPNGLKPKLTVSENLKLTSQLQLTPVCPPLTDILTALQLTNHQHTLAHELSAGQKRRVALARLLLVPKKLWLLDEPLTALDTTTQHFFLTCLTQHLQQGGMAVISSHHPITLPHVSPQTIRLPSC
ncbi:MAG: heme ABC exporter, ATP-binding protein CcmA [Gammaproteobacteria bacterium RIFCSPHIGHO2_12_FULL_45_12]|nr:MAG: heme ABC exporter, ATP-binding protein CcmA [Gammaproteobacteria bacterium RIFCSPHIGHO2_12_FULL_45_12]